MVGGGDGWRHGSGIPGFGPFTRAGDRPQGP
jgi:hypothetical protein